MFSYSRFGENVETRVGPQENVLALSQRIPFPGKLGLKGKMAQQDGLAQEQQYEATKRDVVFKVKQAYYDLYWVVGYLIKYRDYENLPESSYFEHQLFGRFSWVFPTNTSLIFYARYGLKDYETQTLAMVISDSLGSHHGHGRGSGIGNRSSVVYSQYQTPSTSQFIGSIRLGQSVTSTTGAQYSLSQAH